MGHDDTPDAPPDDSTRPVEPTDQVALDEGAKIIPLHAHRDDAARTEVPAEAAAEDATEDAGLSFSNDDEMTLDAFEQAVQRAVTDQLGGADDEAAPGPPQGADELVASVLSALSGSDAKSALSQVREELGKQRDQAPLDNVIDLQAAREARRQPTPLDLSRQLGDVLKNTFGAFLVERATDSASGEIVLDSAFFRAHGAELLGNLFQSLTSALIPRSASRPVGTERTAATAATEASADASTDKDTAGDAATPEASAARAGDAPTEPEPEPGPIAATDSPTPGSSKPVPEVKINIDLGDILASLFRRRPRDK